MIRWKNFVLRKVLQMYKKQSFATSVTSNKKIPASILIKVPAEDLI
ncbi:MAG: hypothetical protein WAU24_12660 [Chitinophagaceae bacterium]